MLTLFRHEICYGGLKFLHCFKNGVAIQIIFKSLITLLIKKLGQTQESFVLLVAFTTENPTKYLFDLAKGVKIAKLYMK